LRGDFFLNFNKQYNCLLTDALFIFYSLIISGQEGTASFEVNNAEPSSSKIDLDSPPIIEMPSFDVQAMIDEDNENEAQGFGLNRFAKGFDVNYTMDNSGVWDVLDNGDRLWRIGFKSEDAQSLNIIFSNLHISEEASLYVYNGDDTPTVLGPFSFAYNQLSGILPTNPLRGDEIYVEYLFPKDSPIRGDFIISKISHEYNGSLSCADDEFDGFGNSNPCNICINDPQADEWQVEKRAVVRILFDGNKTCSGTLINNTNGDHASLILTANHCIETQQSLDRAIIHFNYENACDDFDGTKNLKVVGGNLLATRSLGPDFTLFRLKSRIPTSYRPYYAGWDNRNFLASSAVTIHHPEGDVKKITFEDDIVENEDEEIIVGDGTGINFFIFNPNTLWRVDVDRGALEERSSGSSLINQDKRIIGVLSSTRGTSACAPDLTAHYGKFSEAWDGRENIDQQLEHWLDPGNTNVSTLDGISPRGWRHGWPAGWNAPSNQDIHSGNKSLEDGEGGQIFYRGQSDNRIHQYWWSSFNGWNHELLADGGGGTNQPVAGDLAVGEGNQVFYRGNDGRMQTYFWLPGPFINNWRNDVVHPIKNISDICGAVLVGHDNQLFYRGTDNRLQSFYFTGGQYVHTYISDENKSRRIDGDLVINEVTNQIFYRGKDGKMHTYFWDNGWQHQIITTPENISRACGALSVNDQSLVYRSTDNRVHLILNMGESWKYHGVLGDNDDKKVAGSVYIGNTQIYYRGTDGKMHTHYKRSSVDGDHRGDYGGDYLEASWQAPSIHNVSGPITVSESQVFYRGTGGEINNYYWDPTGFRSATNLYGMEETAVSPTIPSHFLKDFEINVNIYPNPTKGQFTVDLALNASQEISIEVFDITGKIVTQPLNDQYLTYGTHKIDINFSTMPRGTYFCRIKSNDFSATKKIMVLQ